MKEFKKKYTMQAPPDEVYMALTNPKSILLWTGEAAEMSTEPGSEFSMWDGSIVGKNIEFIENRKIVQQWYFDGQTEKSIVTIMIYPNKKASTVELTHTNIPDDEFNDFAEGWDESYFASLKVFFED